MVRTNTGSLSGVLALALELSSAGRAFAQEPQPAPTSTPQAAQPASTTDAAQPTSDHGNSVAPATDVAAPTTDAKETTTPAASKPASAGKGKKGKQEYNGPMTLVILAPTPMLDEEGNQRQDPDGKLMFNP